MCATEETNYGSNVKVAVEVVVVGVLKVLVVGQCVQYWKVR